MFQEEAPEVEAAEAGKAVYEKILLGVSIQSMGAAAVKDFTAIMVESFLSFFV